MTPFIKKIAMPALSLTMAASIALTPVSATPARAGSGTDTAVAAGFLALLMAGIVAGSQVQAAPTSRDHYPNDIYHRDTGRRDNGYRGNDPRWTDMRNGPRRPPVIDRSKELPRECRVNYRLGSSSAPYYEKSCLKTEMRDWRALPDRCAQTIRIRGSRTGAHVAYPESCLARFGFSPEGRGGNRVRW